MHQFRRWLLVVPFALGLTWTAPARDKESLTKDRVSETKHTIKVGNTPLEYTATAGTIELKEEGGKPLAGVFFVAYTKNGVLDLAKRPITFTFNGGPGSSSVWLHMGAFAPKKVKLDDDGNALPPPYKLVDNEYHLLDFTDLVFIDPVTTGYSRPAADVPNSKFHGVQQDIESVGEFIRLYTTRYKRWQSPKFLAGESYGGTRAAALSYFLQHRHNYFLNGVVLVSPALNFQAIRFDEGNDLPFALFLPTYTASAWYHKKLSKDLQSDLRTTLAEAEAFAQGEYTTALMKGDKLPADQKKQLAAKIARLTGLSEKYVLQTNLRISIQRFCRELLREERKTVGRFDSRFTGFAKDAAGENPDYDASAPIHDGPFAATLNHYLRHDLKYETDLTYEILTGRVQPWDYSSVKNRYLNVTPDLRKAMTQNADLQVFVANGYYDLATPYFTTDYSIDHLSLEPAFAKHVTTRYYEAGHMMYVHKLSHQQLHKDLRAFYQKAVK
jgi:carboxypeptidase C (cathepsin A)